MAGTNITLPQAGDEITSSWGQDVAKGLNGIQTGSVAIVCAASNTAKAVTFPKAFASSPVILVSIDNGIAVHAVGKVQAGATTPSGFGIIISSATGVVLNGTVNAYWIAIGTLA